LTAPLKSWGEIGGAAFTGTGEYRREFTLPSPEQGKHVYLDLGNVHGVARVRLSGVEFAIRPWPPYLWDVSPSIKSGVNTLEVQVRPAPAAEPRETFGAAGPGGRRGGAGAPGTETGAPRGFSPTGVPGGLSADAGGGRGRGMPGPNGGFSPGGAGRGPAPAAAPVAASGLLGPVRVLAQ
jgi:hypothetical protein